MKLAFLWYQNQTKMLQDQIKPKELQVSIPHERWYKNAGQNFSNQIQQYKKSVLWPPEVYPRNARLLSHLKVNVVHHINKAKGKII